MYIVIYFTAVCKFSILTTAN